MRNSDVKYLLWDCPIDHPEGRRWYHVLELVRRPDDRTMATLRASVFMYGWLDLGPKVLGDPRPNGIACWHARQVGHPEDDVGENVALHDWIVDLLGKAEWT